MCNREKSDSSRLAKVQIAKYKVLITVNRHHVKYEIGHNWLLKDWRVSGTHIDRRVQTNALHTSLRSKRPFIISHGKVNATGDLSLLVMPFTMEI